MLSELLPHDYIILLIRDEVTIWKFEGITIKRKDE